MAGTDALGSARARFLEAFDAGDVQALEELLADDVVWMAAGRPPWVGKEAVLEQLGGAFEAFRYRFRLDQTRLDRAGDRAVECSNFASDVIGTDGPVGPPHRGSVVIVWVRSEAWQLRAYLDVGGTVFG